MPFALIQGTRVTQVADAQFPVAPDLIWVPCDNTITAGYTYVNGAFVQPAPPPPPTAYQLWVQSVISDTDYQAALTALINATPTQIKNYVGNNVTDLASAKVLLGKILLLLSIIARQS